MATAQDREILNAIFNPLLPNGSLQFDENVPLEFPETEEIFTPECKIAKELEVEGIKAAEEKDYDRALQLLDRAIETAVTRPSGYNNRAQVYRLLGRTEEAMRDLNNAINLGGGQGRAGAQAYCQRGLLHLKEGREGEARRDFESAAALGSQFAKAQLVQMNPYAALCNKMLRGVFERLQKGVPTAEEEERSKVTKD